MTRCAFTAPLRERDAWIEDCEGTDDVQVADAILRWFDEQGFHPPPDDAEFAAARWFVPADTCPESPASRLRVVMPNGDRYELEIEREGDLRGEDWHEVRYYRVTSARVDGVLHG
jgi:hypothetical protein